MVATSVHGSFGLGRTRCDTQNTLRTPLDLLALDSHLHQQFCCRSGEVPATHPSSTAAREEPSGTEITTAASADPSFGRIFLTVFDCASAGLCDLAHPSGHQIPPVNTLRGARSSQISALFPNHSARRVCSHLQMDLLRQEQNACSRHWSAGSDQFLFDINTD